MSRALTQLPLTMAAMTRRALQAKVKLSDDEQETGSAQEWMEKGTKAYEARQYLEAMTAWKRAAASAHADAQFRIGQLYARGEGVARSVPDAVQWYKAAAQVGHTEAQFNLARIYIDGADPTPNGPNQWFNSAVRHDPDAARRTLDVLFPNGLTVEKDPEIRNPLAERSGRGREGRSSGPIGRFVSTGDWRQARLRRGKIVVFAGG